MKADAQLIPVHSPIIGAIAMLMGLYGLTTPNPLETVWAGFMLWLICRLFWWQSVPGIVLYALIIPFIEIHTGVLNANSSGISLDEAYNGTGQHTFWLSSIGLLAVCIGLRSTLKKERLASALDLKHLQSLFNGVSMTRLILTYVVLVILSEVVDFLIPWNSSIRQLEVHVLKLPSVALFAICVHFFLYRRRQFLFAAFMVLVVIQNLYSYFSDWKIPFEILITASLIQFKEFRMPQFLRYAPVLLPILLFVGIWQNIKGEYRYVLSGGREDQSIQITRSEALNSALELATASYQSGSFADSTVIQATYQRTGYLEFFAATLIKVPEEIPHQHGQLTRSNLEYAIVPRILNPTKGAKDDRAKVEKYTGYYFGGERAISSFSLGHYCEAFIDWGRIGMMIHLFLYGCFGGYLLNLLGRKRIITESIFGSGIMFTLLSFWGTYQKDMITLTGSLLWGGLAFLVLFPPLLRNLPTSVIK